MRILLIGLPTSGKTFIGKAISDKLNYFFINQDEYMEKMFPEHETLNELFTRNNFINSAYKISSFDDTVVASSSAFGIIQNACNIFDITIYLKISEELFIDNILNARKAPFTKDNRRRRLVCENDNVNNISNTENIKDLFESRKNLYPLNADYTFSISSEEDLLSVSDKILELINSKLN